MFSGSDPVLRRGAERWERTARNREDQSTEPTRDESSDHAEGTAGSKHRAAAVPPAPWRQRPRTPLDGSLHRFYLAAVLVVGGLLWGGAASVVAGPSVATRLTGALAFVGGAALAGLAVIYLRRPVEH